MFCCRNSLLKVVLGIVPSFLSTLPPLSVPNLFAPSLSLPHSYTQSHTHAPQQLRRSSLDITQHPTTPRPFTTRSSVFVWYQIAVGTKRSLCLQFDVCNWKCATCLVELTDPLPFNWCRTCYLAAALRVGTVYDYLNLFVLFVFMFII